MARPPVGVDEQSTRHTSTPKGRFVLRADSIRPYSGVCVQPTFWYSISIVMKKIDFPQPDWYTRNKKEVIP